MTFSFRPARRSEAKPLIGLYAESGAGKTYSALLLARGFAGTGKIGMIETEAGRGEAYADLIEAGYSVIPLRSSFAASVFGEAITAAEAAGIGCLIIDSASHEWSGVGGVLAQAQERQDAGVKGVLAWQKPKMEHQRHFMLRLMQTPIPLVIVCMRAKYPMQQNAKKEWERSTVLEPDQASDILFEMFVHGWIDREHRLHVTKLTRPDLATVFLDKQPITIDTGRRLAAWAKAGQAIPHANPTPPAADHPGGPVSTEPHHPGPAASVPSPFNTDAATLSPDEQHWDQILEQQAKGGVAGLQAQWEAVPKELRRRLKPRLDKVHKPEAIKADA